MEETMRRSLAIFFSIISIIIFQGALKPAFADNETKKFVSKQKDFSISFPKNWTIRTDVQNTCVVAVSPLEKLNNDFRETINVSSETLKKRMKVHKYLEFVLAYNRINLYDFSTIKTSDTKICGLKAKKCVYIYTLNNQKYMSVMYILVKNYKGYVITGCSVPESFSRYISTFDKIAMSFKLE
jgi:hypothetical protein